VGVGHSPYQTASGVPLAVSQKRAAPPPPRASEGVCVLSAAARPRGASLPVGVTDASVEWAACVREVAGQHMLMIGIADIAPQRPARYRRYWGYDGDDPLVKPLDSMPLVAQERVRAA